MFGSCVTTAAGVLLELVLWILEVSGSRETGRDEIFLVEFVWRLLELEYCDFELFGTCETVIA